MGITPTPSDDKKKIYKEPYCNKGHGTKCANRSQCFCSCHLKGASK